MDSTKPDKSERVLVHVRIRPFNSTELADPDQVQTSLLSISQSPPSLLVKKDYDKKSFHFDSVLDSSSTQEQTYQQTGKVVVLSVLAGYNASILAYGQTGTGKTHTMVGEEEAEKGIIPRALEDILETVHTDPEFSYTINIGFVQVYMEMLQDLLFPDSPTPIRIREDPSEGVYLTGSTWKSVHTLSDCMNLLSLGNNNRNSAFTSMNAQSSRSHAVFLVRVEKRYQRTEDNERSSAVISSMLNLVDLAGSERVKKSKATGLRFDEAKNINLALLALGNCIQALSDKKSKYVPYRDSKLTRLLANSLGGSSKTSLIITIGPSLAHVTETLSTLNFGTRAMKIEINPSVSKLIDYKAAYTKLKAELELTNDKYNALIKTNTRLLEEIEAIRKEKAHLEIEKLKAETAAEEYLKLLEGTKGREQATVELEKLNELQRRCELQLRQKEVEYTKLLTDFDQFIQESDAENNKLRNEKADLMESNHNYKAKLAFLTGEREQEKAVFANRLSELTKEKLEFKTQAETLQNDNKSQLMLLNAQEIKLKRLLSELETLKKAKSAGKATVWNSQKEAQMQELAAENAKLREELRDTEIIVGEKREEIEQLRVELTKSDVKLLRKELEKARKEIEGYGEAKLAFEMRIFELETALKSKIPSPPVSPTSQMAESKLISSLLQPLQDRLEVDCEALEGQLRGLVEQPSGIHEDTVVEFAEALYTATHPETIGQIAALKAQICELEDQMKGANIRDEAQREKLTGVLADMQVKYEEYEPRTTLEVPSFMQDSSDEEEAETLLEEFSEGMAWYLTDWLVLKTVLSSVQESFGQATVMVQRLQAEKQEIVEKWSPVWLQQAGVVSGEQQEDWWQEAAPEETLFSEYLMTMLEEMMEKGEETWGNAVAAEAKGLSTRLGVSISTDDIDEVPNQWQDSPETLQKLAQSDPQTLETHITSLITTQIDTIGPPPSLPLHSQPLLPLDAPALEQASVAFYYAMRWNELFLQHL